MCRRVAAAMSLPAWLSCRCRVDAVLQAVSAAIDIVRRLVPLGGVLLCGSGYLGVESVSILTGCGVVGLGVVGRGIEELGGGKLLDVGFVRVEELDLIDDGGLIKFL